MDVVKGSNNARRGTPPTSQILVMSVTSPQNGNPPNYLTGRCERTRYTGFLVSCLVVQRTILVTFSMKGFVYSA